jgi:hypothetical protein
MKQEPVETVVVDTNDLIVQLLSGNGSSSSNQPPPAEATRPKLTGFLGSQQPQPVASPNAPAEQEKIRENEPVNEADKKRLKQMLIARANSTTTINASSSASTATKQLNAGGNMHSSSSISSSSSSGFVI